jgi:hypothetical protein
MSEAALLGSGLAAARKAGLDRSMAAVAVMWWLQAIEDDG